MKRTIITIIGGLLVALLPSCIKDDTEDCSAHLYIELDWLNTAPRSDQEQVQLSVIPEDFQREEIRMTSNPYGREADLQPDYYRFVGWETAENITVVGDTITLAVGTESNVLEPEPFGGGSTQAQVYARQSDQVVHLPMRQQTRPLCIKVYFTGYGAPELQGLSAVLEGITIERKINDAFAPASGSARPAAIRNGSAHYSFGWNESHWFSTQRLIGVDGEAAQKLTLTANFTGGYTDTISLDVTGKMFGYHTENVDEPWCIVLEVDLTELLIMTITDWYAGAESWIVAE